ncbi:hypothetical protein Pmani_038293 [Petrolisthes manimaculis]|uniref:Uncharacterized protein n=1 Tax=Petrolisthes manimaculis TaxID=1843537 RepID=A0AAE1NEQ6_9EUCA|nr:hypothetical protein Pmani_038293 [Petrolisthes manimaculis]
MLRCDEWRATQTSILALSPTLLSDLGETQGGTDDDGDGDEGVADDEGVMVKGVMLTTVMLAGVRRG